MRLLASHGSVLEIFNLSQVCLILRCVNMNVYELMSSRFFLSRVVQRIVLSSVMMSCKSFLFGLSMTDL